MLTLANIFLTIRLFHSSQSPTIPVINCAIQQHRLDQQSSPVVNHQQTPAIPTLANPAPLDCDYGGIYSNYTAYSSSHIIFSQLDLRLGRWDKSRIYKIHDNVFVGDDYPAISEKFSVCIATQSSLERLGSLVSCLSIGHKTVQSSRQSISFAGTNGNALVRWSNIRGIIRIWR